MPSTYKTPGVYVEEISKFPPSVAPVETAIPAFIGYTEMATEFTPNDLNLVPTKISSLVEYEAFFGTGPSANVTAVTIDENNVLATSTMGQSYYLYDSLRMFYNNGGGDCYIISVGLYSDGNNQLADYQNGLTKLKKVDEPTLILFPDAIAMSTETDIYTLQKLALAQCADLQDRFCVFDMLESKASDVTFDWDAGVTEFRDNIGVNDLKYGAVYTPHLKSNLGFSVTYRDIQGIVTRGGIPVDFSNLTDSADAQTILSNLETAIADNDYIDGRISTFVGAEDSIRAAFTAVVDTFQTTNNTANYKAIMNFIYDLANEIDAWLSGANVTGTDLNTDLGNLITDALVDPVEDLAEIDEGANSEVAGTYQLYSTDYTWNAAQWGTIFTGVTANTAIFVGATDAEKRSATLSTLQNIFELVYTAFSSAVSSASTYESDGEDALYESHDVFKNLITALRSQNSVLPPSGAICGIYAKVDNDRGVWKAPANVSLTSVVGLTETIDNNEQDGLNVDTVSGKSINAIRAFTGKGILVWGARTLAGNDNEWRYVPVRRFFNFAEESIRKATEGFVFEPNDANTWVKVRAMIENFLTVQWRAGALAGAKPEHAFFVKVGLGETMTSLDILEGRMIVEIGMAAVRPAEFIILRFSHKMQES